VFMFDGSEKYSGMTVNAIKSFLAVTPNVNVGVLVPANLRAESLASLKNELAEWKNKVDIRHFKDHFANWNPTQVCTLSNLRPSIYLPIAAQTGHSTILRFV